MTGEIIDGELFVTPRPSRKHGYTSSALGSEVAPVYQFGRGGPGGWIFIIEPEVKFEEDILVPDIAGWRRERFPVEEPHNWISAVPDWVAEVLSPGQPEKIKSRKCPSMLGMEYPTVGSLTRSRRLWTYSSSNPSDGFCWLPLPTMTRSGRNRSWRWRSIWVISGYSSLGHSDPLRIGSERLTRIHHPSTLAEQNLDKKS